MAREVRVRSSGWALAVEAALRDLGPALQAVGAMVASAGQDAFRLQRFGDIPWPEQYPNQSGPFVHVAGAVTDLSRGPTVATRRLKRIPAGIDTATLQRSITHAVVGDDAVEVGSAMEYANTFHAGGITRQPITPEVRANLAKWLRTSAGRPYRDRLGFLFHADTLETNVAARPFVGLTDQLRADIIEEVEQIVAEEIERHGEP